MITDTDPATITTLIQAATIGLSGIILLLVHEFADHWGQRHSDAACKGERTRRGQIACATHVVMYLAQTHGALLTVLLLVGLPFHPVMFVVGLVVNGAQHYWADRRVYIEQLAKATGRGEFFNMGRPKDAAGTPGAAKCLGTGGYILDQSFHKGWIAVVAVLTGLGAGI